MHCLSFDVGDFLFYKTKRLGCEEEVFLKQFYMKYNDDNITI